MKTLRELADDLATYDEVTVLEVLALEAQDIVNRFMDIIEDRQDYIRQWLGEASPDEAVQDGRDFGFKQHFDGYDYDEWN